MNGQVQISGNPIRTITRIYATCLCAALAVLVLPGVAHAGLLSKSTTQPGEVTSAAVSLGDLLAVGESQAQAGASKYTYLRLGDDDVLTYNSNGTWTGSAAGLGTLVDDLNDSDCQPVGDLGIVCYRILRSSAVADSSSASSGGTLAVAALGLNPAEGGGIGSGGSAEVAIAQSNSEFDGVPDEDGFCVNRGSATPLRISAFFTESGNTLSVDESGSIAPRPC